MEREVGRKGKEGGKEMKVRWNGKGSGKERKGKERKVRWKGKGSRKERKGRRERKERGEGEGKERKGEERYGEGKESKGNFPGIEPWMQLVYRVAWPDRQLDAAVMTQCM
jgi:hypothetical protein